MQTDNLELKKLVYLYLMNYAKSQPDMAIMAVNTFVKVSGSLVGGAHCSISPSISWGEALWLWVETLRLLSRPSYSQPEGFIFQEGFIFLPLSKKSDAIDPANSFHVKSHKPCCSLSSPGVSHCLHPLPGQDSASV